MTLRHFITLFLPLVVSLSAYADDQLEKFQKEAFKILSKYRVDIPAEVLKKAKKELITPCIHDSWIENSFGKSMDLQGNELFPEYNYNECSQLSATHFELKNSYSWPWKKGVVRTDGRLIVPIENTELRYYPEAGLILAFVDFDLLSSGKAGTVKVYDYNGTLHKTIENCSNVVFSGPYSSWKWNPADPVTIDWNDSSGTHREYLRGVTSSITQLDNATSFFYEGPQATIFNIIRDLCASEKKDDLNKAIVLLDYYVWKILPHDSYSEEQSRAVWDATCKKISCVLASGGGGGLTSGSTSGMAKYLSWNLHYRHCFFDDLSREPILPLVIGEALPEAKAMRERADGLLKLAYAECKNQQIKAAEREQMWANVLQVLAGAFSSMPGSSGARSYSGGAMVNTTPSAMPGQRMIDQTTISPEIMGAAISAGWTPESTATDTSSESKAGSSSTSSRTCHACFGSGKHQACNGAGTQLAFGNKRMEKCSQCHGSGKCPQCGGQGHH